MCYLCETFESIMDPFEDGVPDWTFEHRSQSLRLILFLSSESSECIQGINFVIKGYIMAWHVAPLCWNKLPNPERV